jgi:glycosyltransferase involved in cell wall biosynthesis
MLQRALDSVSGQDFWRFEWLVVNDAGDRAAVDRVVAAATERGLCARALHRDRSSGMEAASNAGLRAARGRWVVLHDDDDSWAPGFLRTTVAALSAGRLRGVVTRSVLVEEVVADDGIVETGRRPYNPGLTSVQLADFCVRNHFPPISFLFDREFALSLGGFDEDLPVLGDWDFVLRFLQVADIGCLPQELANYHHRSDSSGVYANSLTRAVERHQEYDAVVRHKHFRADLAAGRVGVGQLLLQARMASLQHAELTLALPRADGVVQEHVAHLSTLSQQLGFVSNQLTSVQSRFENTVLHLRVAARKVPMAKRFLRFEDEVGEPGGP